MLALDGVSLEVEPGEIFGLLGPNGAGKTTTIGILTTRVRPTEGRAWIGRTDVWQDPVSVKRRIGVVPQRPNLDFQLTAREILLFHGAYFGMSRDARHAKADLLLDRFQLTERADEMVQGFSGGMQQRLSLARALVHEPEVLFLDEPSAGLDPQSRLLLWDLVRDYNRSGRTVILTTHYMEEADSLCDRIAIVDHGKVIEEGTPAGLKRTIPGGYLIQIRVDGDPDGLLPKLEALDGVSELRRHEDEDGPRVEIYADRGGSLIPGVASLVAESGLVLTDVHLNEPSLETLFLHHTGRSLRE